MEIRYQESPDSVKQMTTLELRDRFLVTSLFKKNEIVSVYSHYDRMIIGGVMPVNKSLHLPNDAELKADYFLQRREMGVINLGGPGRVQVDTKWYELDNLDCIYIGKSIKKVQFKSNSKNKPALFYFLSAPAHSILPVSMMKKTESIPVNLGEKHLSNQRTIFKYIHTEGIKSCQLVMGVTILAPGSVWNSIPPHTHTRRMEVYFYFEVPEQHRVFHFMGQPSETQHLIVANHQGVISPPWSVHFGCGTASYGFVWGMAGENQEFTDMDPAPISTLL